MLVELGAVAAAHRGVFDDRHRRLRIAQHHIAERDGLGELRRIGVLRRGAADQAERREARGGDQRGGGQGEGEFAAGEDHRMLLKGS